MRYFLLLALVGGCATATVPAASVDNDPRVLHAHAFVLQMQATPAYVQCKAAPPGDSCKPFLPQYEAVIAQAQALEAETRARVAEDIAAGQRERAGLAAAAGMQAAGQAIAQPQPRAVRIVNCVGDNPAVCSSY